MKTATVIVTQWVKVTVDETKFTKQFMKEFRESFYPLGSINAHIEHLAQMFVRGLYNNMPSTFIEGYGKMGDMGISFEIVETEIETQ
jgi:hypothetical protein